MSPSPHPVVIVGAGLAGVRVAQRLRALHVTTPIVMVGDEIGLPYDRPPLSKSLLTGALDEALPTPLISEEELAAGAIDFRRGRRALSLDTARRTVELDDGSRLDYSTLVITTGSRARTLDDAYPGAGILTLRTSDDAVRLRARLESARHATVIGAGVLGLEIAAGIRHHGLDVSVVESLDQPMARVVGPMIGAHVARLHRDHGITIHTGRRITTLLEHQGTTQVTLDTGQSWESDLVVAAIGGTPQTEWVGDSLDTLDGGIICDRFGVTSDPHVFAAGDVVRLLGRDGLPAPRTEHWTSAVDLAQLVAANIAADPADRRPYADAPYFWSDQLGVKIQGLGTPNGDDDVVTVMGAFDDGKALALFSRAGIVTGAVAWNAPPALMRCRAAVVDAIALDSLLNEAPWERTARAMIPALIEERP